MADDRTYIRVHDGMDEHPKIEPLSDGAFRLLMRCWFYCSRNRTDGKLPDAIWKKRGTPKARRELIDAGLVEQCDGHVEMHDYLEHQRSADEIKLLKDVRGDTGSYGNHVRWHVVKRKPKPGCEHCEADPTVAKPSQTRSQTDRKRSRKTIASTEAEAEAEDLSTEGGGSHVSSESPERPPLYPDHCQRHNAIAVPGACGDCADVRKANAANPRPLQLVADRKRCIVHDTTYDRICNGCESDRKAASA